MAEFNHGKFMDALRARRGKVPADLYQDIMAALEAGLGRGSAAQGALPTAIGGEPAWLNEARRHIGMKEIPGARHNPTIMGWIKSLKYWFTDDETAWCGTFVSWCMMAAGLTPPKDGYRAKSFSTWGVPCKPQVGAVGVKSRKGGGHVFLIVGITADGAYYLCLGGNQDNQVNISPIAVSAVTDIRWPAGVPENRIKLPVMRKGVIAKSEA